MAKKKQAIPAVANPHQGYKDVLSSMVELLESARRMSARAVNSIMTATYWEIGRRIVELDQGGEGRARYGAGLIPRLAADLTSKLGRGFSERNIEQMRLFYQAWPKAQTVSAELHQPLPRLPGTSPQTKGKKKAQTVSALLTNDPVQVLSPLMGAFQLPWSHYVKLLSVTDEAARRFYEKEALLGGWSVRQLKRQIDSQFYERTLLSKNKGAMLTKGTQRQASDLVTPEEEIKDPLVLEFLDLKDEYSEHDLEKALIDKLEEFLLELGNDFTFIGRQKRLRIGDEWYRIDLLLFHRRLRCLIVIDLKIGKFTHADAGQMHMYLNYAARHWTHEGENPPVGLILCAQHDEAVAQYALDNLPNKVMAAEYKLALPDEKLLVKELQKTQRALEHHRAIADDHKAKPRTNN